MDKLVSIIIPVYNRVNIISETIESALGQRYENFEVVIVDNASTDGTWEVIQQYALNDSRVRVFRNDHNIGAVRNWKRALDEALGYYGKILWSDDLIDEAFLEKTVALFEEDVAFVYSKVRIFTGCVNEGAEVYARKATGCYATDEYIMEALFHSKVPFSPGCAIFRLEDLREALQIDIPNRANIDLASHAIGNDLLIFLKIARRYSRFGYVDEALSFFRSHADSISVSAGGGKLQLYYALAKSFFVEAYVPQYLPKFKAYVIFLFVMFRPQGAFGIRSLKCYFDSLSRIDYFFLAVLFARYAVLTAKRFICSLRD